MVDYQQLENEHRRRVSNILQSERSPRERQQIIDALIRFRDADIVTAERLEREAEERKARGLAEQTWAERSEELRSRQEAADAFFGNALIGVIAIIATTFIGLGFVAAFLP